MPRAEAVKVVCMPSWYPSELDPAPGIFVKEHVQAAALYVSVAIVFVQAVPFRALFGGPTRLVSDTMEDGIRTVRVSFPATWLPINMTIHVILSLYGLWRLSRNFAPTVIHAHIFAPAGFASVICGALFGVPVVITEHYTGFLRKSLSSSGRLIARWAMSRANGVISVSEDLKNHIEAYGVRNRFWIIPNPVDVRNFRVGETAVNDRPAQIVSVTNFRSMAKNVPLLIEAFAEVVGSSDLNPQLHIVGDGPMRPQIEALIDQKGIGARVVLHGFLSRTELADVLADSDLFVLASLWENCPVALLEARLAGLPMVVTAVGGVPEIIDPETGILVESGNVDALVNGILEGLSAAASADRTSIRERAVGQISREAIGKRLIGVYESVS